MPKLKVPEKSGAVSESMDGLINKALTAQCDLEPLVSKYKVPENCEKVVPALVNQEIWKAMDKKAHLQDKSLVDI